jgi:hypothetical protein
MNGRDIVIEERDAPGHREVAIIFPPGPLVDGTPEGCYLGYGRNSLLMTLEHYQAIKEKILTDAWGTQGGATPAVDQVARDGLYELCQTMEEAITYCEDIAKQPANAYARLMGEIQEIQRQITQHLLPDRPPPEPTYTAEQVARWLERVGRSLLKVEWLAAARRGEV